MAIGSQMATAISRTVSQLPGPKTLSVLILLVVDVYLKRRFVFEKSYKIVLRQNSDNSNFVVSGNECLDFTRLDGLYKIRISWSMPSYTTWLL